jgi:hypothetical protein
MPEPLGLKEAQTGRANPGLGPGYGLGAGERSGDGPAGLQSMCEAGSGQRFGPGRLFHWAVLLQHSRP